MADSVCSIVTFGGSTNEARLVKPTAEPVVETISDGFKILSADLYAELLEVSGDGRSTLFFRESLEASLGGTALLVESDGAYRRILTWLWQYGLSTKTFTRTQIGHDVLDPRTGETIYWIYGYSSKLKVRQTVLEDKWSGRIFIQVYRGKFLLFLLPKYFWQVIRKWWLGGSGESVSSSEVPRT